VDTASHGDTAQSGPPSAEHDITSSTSVVFSNEELLGGLACARPHGHLAPLDGAGVGRTAAGALDNHALEFCLGLCKRN
jgi:hypothetical protein